MYRRRKSPRFGPRRFVAETRASHSAEGVREAGGFVLLGLILSLVAGCGGGASSVNASTDGGLPCNLSCGSFSCCGNSCVDPQVDRNNCGGCGSRCPASASVCSGGRCVCPTTCGAQCADLNTDPENCGACGDRCPSSQKVCVGGTCQCPLWCNGACVDPWTDSANCGACGVACPIQATCLARQCVCNGACIDEQTDSGNCGACGEVCSGTCTGGRCFVTLVDAGTAIGPIAVDDSAVYYSSWKIGAPSYDVMAVPKTGGAPRSLASGQSRVHQIAVDSTNAYFSVEGDVNVLKVGKSGGAPVALVFGQLDVHFALAGGNLYFTNTDIWADPPPGLGSSLMAVSTNGGAYATLASGLKGAAAIAADPTSLYFVGTDGVEKVAKSGGPPTTLSSWSDGGGSLEAIGVDPDSVYWIDISKKPHTIMRAPVVGGSASIVAPTPDGSDHLVIDDGYVYWTNPAGGTVMGVSANGGATTVLASQQNAPQALAVDATSVYWATAGGSGTAAYPGTIMKVTPK